MTYKKQLEDAEAADVKKAAELESEKQKRIEERKAIADKLEAHLRENEPEAIGLTLQRDGARMLLASDDFKIVIDADFTEYTGMVFVGEPAQIARGSKRRLQTLPDVDGYITDIVRSKK